MKYWEKQEEEIGILIDNEKDKVLKQVTKAKCSICDRKLNKEKATRNYQISNRYICSICALKICDEKLKKYKLIQKEVTKWLKTTECQTIMMLNELEK